MPYKCSYCYQCVVIIYNNVPEFKLASQSQSMLCFSWQLVRVCVCVSLVTSILLIAVRLLVDIALCLLTSTVAWCLQGDWQQ